MSLREILCVKSEDSRFTHGKVVTGVDGRNETQRSDEGSGTIAEGGEES